MTLIEHLENHFGNICKGWKDSKVGNLIQVVSFENRPFKDIVTYCTISLSDHELVTASGKKVRQEFVFLAYKSFAGEKVASFLSTFSENVVLSSRALLRGDVVGPSGPIVTGSLMNSVYSALPMIFQDSFAVYENSSSTTIFPWLIPIHEEEANYVRGVGWSKFEKLLENRNPELWDLHRTSVVGGQ